MSNQHVKHLLVGGGLASLSAARAIRELDSEGSVLMVGQEHSRPYHRPPLSKQFLLKERQREELFAVEPDWFTRHHVDLRTGCRAARLDVGRRIAALDNGDEISFDHLLLATGASPALLDVPGADLPNVLYLRTIEDCALLHNAVDKARREGRPQPARTGGPSGGRGRAAVVGAGLLGIEVAASLGRLGLAVDVFAAREHPWDKFTGEITGRFLHHFLERHGVIVHPNAQPLRLDGDGRAQRVNFPGSGDFGQGTAHVDCDFAVICIGATANKDLLRGTPIAAGKAILVDSCCRTNVAGIYAAGDCSAVLDPLFGKHRQLDYWDNAKVTGTLAGRNMAGGRETYSVVNRFFSRVFDLWLQGWGESRLVDRRFIRGTPRVEAPDFLEVGVAADGRIAQILRVKQAAADDRGIQGPLPAADDEILRELVARRLQLDGNEERLKDPAFSLASLLQ